MLLNLTADLTYDFPEPCETLLLLEAAQDEAQRVVTEHLAVQPPSTLTRRDDPLPGARRAILETCGVTQVLYRAQVDVDRPPTQLAGLAQSPIRDLPLDALPYLRPSRYCPSDRLERFAEREFGRWAGGDRVAAIQEWISRHIDYAVDASNPETTALDTFTARAGVCRDFAQLMIALCRASDVPARAVSAYAWRLQPADLHAVSEVFVGGAWRLIDATCKAPVEGLVKVATGRDAADIAFMSIFGEAQLVSQAFKVERADASLALAASSSHPIDLVEPPESLSMHRAQAT